MGTARRRKTKYDRLISLGNQMSNILFNLKQQTWVKQSYRDSAEELQKQWDAEKTRMRNVRT